MSVLVYELICIYELIFFPFYRFILVFNSKRQSESDWLHIRYAPNFVLLCFVLTVQSVSR